MEQLCNEEPITVSEFKARRTQADKAIEAMITQAQSEADLDECRHVLFASLALLAEVDGTREKLDQLAALAWAAGAK